MSYINRFCILLLLVLSISSSLLGQEIVPIEPRGEKEAPWEVAPIVEKTEEAKPVVEFPNKSKCKPVVADDLRKAIEAIRKEIKRIKEAMESGAVAKGVSLVLKLGKKELGPEEWDKTLDEIERIFGKEVRKAFQGCYWRDFKANVMRMRAGRKKDLIESVTRRFAEEVKSLAEQVKDLESMLKQCGKCGPCDCFELEVFVGSSLPEDKVLRKYKPLFKRISPHALKGGEPLSEPFLRRIKKARKQGREIIQVPKDGWVAARAVKKDGPVWYTIRHQIGKGKFKEEKINCCFSQHEVGAFVQILVVWPGQSKERVLNGWPPPSRTTYGWVRKGWLAGNVEMSVYHTYSWTPTGYTVRLFNLVAGIGQTGWLYAAGPGGVVLRERREDWVLWIPSPKTGKGLILLVVNGKICQSLKIEVK